MSKYTNQENIEAYLDRELTDAEATLLDFIVEYISNFIKSYTNRNWLDLAVGGEEDLEVTNKVYDGNGYKELFTDDFTSLDEVRILDSQGDVYLTLDDDSEFVLFPHNETTKESIYLRNYIFPTTTAGVEVDAIFTSGEVPSGVIAISSMLCGKFFIKGETKNLKSEDIEGYRYTLTDSTEQDNEVKSALETLGGLRKLQI